LKYFKTQDWNIKWNAILIAFCLPCHRIVEKSFTNPVKLVYPASRKIQKKGSSGFV